MFSFRIYALLPLAAVFSCTFGFQVAPTKAQNGLQAPTLAIPAITTAPFSGFLDRRQAGLNNPICGWINGNGASAVSCGTAYYCATQQSFVGCCSTKNCAGIVTSCYDLLGTDLCNAACQREAGNLVCASSLPYCGTYNYPGGSVGYGCAAASGFTVEVALRITGSDGGTLTLPTTSTTSTSSSTTSSSTTLSIATPTPVPQPHKDGIGGGAIAGIVIGSIATLLAIGAFAFWVITTRRKHREKKQEGYRLSQPSTYGGPTQRSSTPGYYKPDEPERSPTLNQLSPSRASAYGSEFSPSPRETYPMGYSGPPIAEMGVESKYERVGER